MELADVKRVMLTKEPVLWRDEWWIVTGCVMKLTGKNKQAKTAPFYYSVILLDLKTKYHTFEVLIDDVKYKRSGSDADVCSE